jgi:hypothetical protein
MLPTAVVIGAMKCATSAVHAYLDAHPDVAMARRKELNFFSGPEWHRGLDWYIGHFDPGAPVRGESSPGYTSPSFPDTAERMLGVLPGVRLVYLVRDPFERALSQYAHHRRDGEERRPVDEALLDEHSQYVARSRYLDRLAPFLAAFPPEQLHVVVQERLEQQPDSTLDALDRHVGARPHLRSAGRRQHRNVGDGRPPAPASLRRRFLDRVRDDVERLRDFLDDDLPEWHH